MGCDRHDTLKQEVVGGLHDELHRPQFHFSPDSMWMNDPNGMVFFNHEYHLFYQYYPDSTVWGPMHWGHAVSTDMVHWQHLPIALFPDSLGYIFSGSAVVDWKNTSGFGKDGEVPLVAIFTYHDPKGEKAGKNDYQTQGIAYSLDNGSTWKKYDNNPVLGNPGKKDFRDPKVFWHEESSSWVMILAVGQHIEFYRSPNLKDWTLASAFGYREGSHAGVWECPDLFRLQARPSNASPWVMIVNLGSGTANGGSGTQYFVGEFDGYTFINNNDPSEILWLDDGRDNYAGVTWSDIPKKDGRRIFLGWMSNWAYAQKVPTSPWRSAMTIPRSLSLAITGLGLRLRQQPVRELNSLVKDSITFASQSFDQFTLPSLKRNDSLFRIKAKLTGVTGLDSVGLRFSNDVNEHITFLFIPGKNRFIMDRRHSGKDDFEPGFAGIHRGDRKIRSDTLDIDIFLDVASIEVFADHGLTVMTDIFFPSRHYDKINLIGGEGLQVLDFKLYSLTSIYGKEAIRE